MMMFWYWGILILGFASQNTKVIYLSFIFIILRVFHGLAMRVLTRNKIAPLDFVIPWLFDLFATFYLIFSFNSRFVVWRGIRYEVKKGGYIEASVDEDMLSEEEINI